MDLWKKGTLVSALLFFLSAWVSQAQSDVPPSAYEVLMRHDRISEKIEALNQKINDYVDGKSSETRKEIANHRTQLFQLSMKRAQINRELGGLTEQVLPFYISQIGAGKHHLLTEHRIITYVMARFVDQADMQMLHEMIARFVSFLKISRPDSLLMKATFLRLRAILFKYEVSKKIRIELYRALTNYIKNEKAWIEEYKNNELRSKFYFAIQRERAVAVLDDLFLEIKKLEEKRDWGVLGAAIIEFFNLLDLNRDRKTNLSEIIKMVQRITVNQGQELLNEYRWFVENHFDMDPVLRKDFTTFLKLRKTGMALLAAMDVDRDRMVSRDEFIRFFQYSLFTVRVNKKIEWITFEDADLNQDELVTVSELEKAIENWDRLPPNVKKRIRIRFLGHQEGLNKKLLSGTPDTIKDSIVLAIESFIAHGMDWIRGNDGGSPVVCLVCLGVCIAKVLWNCNFFTENFSKNYIPMMCAPLSTKYVEPVMCFPPGPARNAVISPTSSPEMFSLRGFFP